MESSLVVFWGGGFGDHLVMIFFSFVQVMLHKVINATILCGKMLQFNGSYLLHFGMIKQTKNTLWKS